MTRPQKYKITTQDLRDAAQRRAEWGDADLDNIMVRVDDDLQVYLLEYLARLLKVKGAVDAFAVLHTLIEVSVEAGRVLGATEERQAMFDNVTHID